MSIPTLEGPPIIPGNGRYLVLIGTTPVSAQNWSELPAEYDDLVAFVPLVPIKIKHTPEEHVYLNSLPGVFKSFFQKARNNASSN